ncbi:MAG TPA: hypothetical protein VGD60_13505 [Candidatus Acidoferrales bacterium]
MKTSLIFIFLCSLVIICTSFATAQTPGTQTGSIQFTARITPAGGVDEPVRSFPFYLLRKSYADIEKEAAATMPASDMNAFIATLDVSPELKAWMKTNQCVNLSGEEFQKKLKIDDVIKVPEFFSAYVERMTTDASVNFPNPKYKPADKVKDPEKYEEAKKTYLDAVRVFSAKNPKSLDDMGLVLEDVNPGHKWDMYRSKDQTDLDQHTTELAEGSYLAARTSTDVDGGGSIRGVLPGTYWISSLNIPAESGATHEIWDVPVTVVAGKTSYATLSNINAVHHRRANP